MKPKSLAGRAGCALLAKCWWRFRVGKRHCSLAGELTVLKYGVSPRGVTSHQALGLWKVIPCARGLQKGDGFKSRGGESI